MENDEFIRLVNAHSEQYKKTLKEQQDSQMTIENDAKVVANLLRNSVSGYKKEQTLVPQGRNQFPIKKYLVIGLTATMTLIGGIKCASNPQMNDTIKRKIALQNSQEFMDKYIITILENSGCEYQIVNNDINLLGDEKQLRGLIHTLKDYGFEEDTAFYCIYQSCGKDDLNKICNAEGYNGLNGYMESKKFIIDYKPNFNKFENWVELDYIETTQSLESIEQIKGGRSNG